LTGRPALQIGEALFAACNIRLGVLSAATGGPLDFVQESVPLGLPSEKFSTRLVSLWLKCFTPLAHPFTDRLIEGPISRGFAFAADGDRGDMQADGTCKMPIASYVNQPLRR
jgi:hypothetical protein